MDESTQGQLASILYAGEKQLLAWGVEHDFTLKVKIDSEKIWHSLECEIKPLTFKDDYLVVIKEWIDNKDLLCQCMAPALEKSFLILEHAHEKVIISLAVSLRDDEVLPEDLTGKIVLLNRLQRVYYESLRVIAWSGAENSKVNKDLAKPLQAKITKVRDILGDLKNRDELISLGTKLALKLDPLLEDLSSEELNQEVLYHIEEMRVKDFVSPVELPESELSEQERYTLSFLKEWGSHVYAARNGFSESLPYILTGSSRWLYELTKQKWEVSNFWNPEAPLVKEAVLLWSESDDQAPYSSLETALLAADKLFK